MSPPRGRAGPSDLRLVLVRHGEAMDHEVPGSHQGPLTPLGHRQAARVARRLASETLSHIYTSDYSRAHDTALAIAKRHAGTPFVVTPDVREVNGLHTRRGRTPRGRLEETRRQSERVERFVRRLITTHRPGETVLVVTHGNFINLFVALLAGWDPKAAVPLDTPNASVTVVTWRADPFARWVRPVRIDLLGCVAHLPQGMVTGRAGG